MKVSSFLASREYVYNLVKEKVSSTDKTELFHILGPSVAGSIARYYADIYCGCVDEDGVIFFYDDLDPAAVTNYICEQLGIEPNDCVLSYLCHLAQKAINTQRRNIKKQVSGHYIISFGLSTKNPRINIEKIEAEYFRKASERTAADLKIIKATKK